MIKKYSQFGTLSVFILFPLCVFFLLLLLRSGSTNSPEFYVQVIVAATLLIALLIFYKLTITIDNTKVSFRLGVGLVGKTYKIEDIKSCKPVVNSALYGVGIRMLPNGWLYNVTGLKAVEIQFKHKKSVVRIGTNKSEEISELIQSLIGGNGSDEVFVGSNKKWINSLWVLIILIIPALIIIPNFQETKVEMDNTQFKIKGIFGLTISYSDVEQIDTVSVIPCIAIRTNVYALGKTLIGNFKLSDQNHVKLFIKKGYGPYIVIKSHEKVPVYFNFEDKKKTVSLYNELKRKI